MLTTAVDSSALLSALASGYGQLEQPTAAGESISISGRSAADVRFDASAALGSPLDLKASNGVVHVVRAPALCAWPQRSPYASEPGR